MQLSDYVRSEQSFFEVHELGFVAGFCSTSRDSFESASSDAYLLATILGSSSNGLFRASTWVAISTMYAPYRAHLILYLQNGGSP